MAQVKALWWKELGRAEVRRGQGSQAGTVGGDSIPLGCAGHVKGEAGNLQEEDIRGLSRVT